MVTLYYLNQLASRTLVGGITGGITSQIYGGSFGQGFGQGAYTAGMGYLFNQMKGQLIGVINGVAVWGDGKGGVSYGYPPGAVDGGTQAMNQAMGASLLVAAVGGPTVLGGYLAGPYLAYAGLSAVPYTPEITDFVTGFFTPPSATSLPAAAGSTVSYFWPWRWP